MSRLGDRAPDEVRDHLSLLAAQGIQGLVVDLRLTAIGSHDAALEVAGHFLDGGLVVTGHGFHDLTADREIAAELKKELRRVIPVDVLRIDPGDPTVAALEAQARRRYVERAENVARFMEVNLQLMLDAPAGSDQQWEPLVATTGDHEDFALRFGAPTQANVVEFLTFDPENPNSIFSCLRTARENARSVREIISSEMWLQLNKFYLMVNDAAVAGHAPRAEMLAVAGEPVHRGIAVAVRDVDVAVRRDGHVGGMVERRLQRRPPAMRDSRRALRDARQRSALDESRRSERPRDLGRLRVLAGEERGQLLHRRLDRHVIGERARHDYHATRMDREMPRHPHQRLRLAQAAPGRFRACETYAGEGSIARTAAAHDYRGFYEKELRFRKWMRYPPFTALANLLIRSPRLEEALRMAGAVGRWFQESPPAGVRVLGPAAAPILRLRSDYRYHFVLKAESRQRLNAALRAMLARAAAQKITRSNLIVDVDPLSLL